MSRCTSRADEADDPSALGEGDQQKTATGRITDDDLSALSCRVVRVVVDASQRIAEHRECFLELHTMLSKVRRRLRRVPRKLHRHQRQAYHPATGRRLPDGLTLHSSARCFCASGAMHGYMAFSLEATFGVQKCVSLSFQYGRPWPS